MMTTDEMVSAFSSSTLHEGASHNVIAKLQQLVGRVLSPSYVDLMSRSNGLEGFLNDANYLILWPVEQLPELNRCYRFSELLPELWLFGSNGGDAGYAFDTRHEPMPVKEVPFIGMSRVEAKTVASSFEGFIEYLRKN
jgi:hypothetical protein